MFIYFLITQRIMIHDDEKHLRDGISTFKEQKRNEAFISRSFIALSLFQIEDEGQNEDAVY